MHHVRQHIVGEHVACDWPTTFLSVAKNRCNMRVPKNSKSMGLSPVMFGQTSCSATVGHIPWDDKAAAQHKPTYKQPGQSGTPASIEAGVNCVSDQCKEVKYLRSIYGRGMGCRRTHSGSAGAVKNVRLHLSGRKHTHSTVPCTAKVPVGCVGARDVRLAEPVASAFCTSHGPWSGYRLPS